MEKRNDGGPAFPTNGARPGMMLRDYFAGQALVALLQVVKPADPADDKPFRFAQISYEMADAMLAEREK